MTKYAFQTQEGKTVFSINKEMNQIWEKQKELLNEKAQIVAGKEVQYEALERSYGKLLKLAVELAEQARQKVDISPTVE